MDNKQKQEYEELCDSLADRYCRLLLITGDSPSKKDLLHLTPRDMELLQEDNKETMPFPLTTRNPRFPINPSWGNTLKQFFGNLIKISVSMLALESALQCGGSAKVEELKQRFAEHVDSFVRSKDLNVIRIVLE